MSAKKKKQNSRQKTVNQNPNPKPRTKRKKDRIDLICEEKNRYNAEHGTAYSYGEYTALVRMGKIKSRYRGKRDFDLPFV